MMIDWGPLEYAGALLGGALIGASAALYVLGAGRIAGIAGIVGSALHGLVRRRRIDALYAAFLAGLLIAPWLWRLAWPLPSMHSSAAIWVLITAGLLVGIGVRMGGGCTSGHGVCGLARLSLRSLVNVLAFMGAGVAAVFVVRHLIGG